MQAPSDSTAPDVIVIGAGAAGLMAAIRAAERGRRVILLEKNRKAGVKILMSGGTRCNITHDCGPDGIVEAFGSSGPFLYPALAALPPSELVAFFHADGVKTKVEPGGKVFPQSNSAADVLEALLSRLRRSGAELRLGEAVTKVEWDGKAFRVTTTKRDLVASRIVITAGGKSYPGSGTTGDGYAWLAAFGHMIQHPRPALVPLVSDEAWLHELSGVTVPDVVVRVLAAPEAARAQRGHGKPGRRVTIERRGAILFTHFGLSGPAILDVSRAVTDASGPTERRLHIDFRPGSTVEELSRELQRAASADGKKLVMNVLAGCLPKKLSQALIGRAGISEERRAAEVLKAERAAIVNQVKQCEVCIKGSRGFEKAEVTAGGVSLDEVNPRTMESKLMPGLFIAGEILDLDGFIGGYNFQAAFSTGWLAGEQLNRDDCLT
jgi:predicted Rossmann fold flavoprotein